VPAAQVPTKQTCGVDNDPYVIHLRLERPQEMFELPQSDLFSEHRNFLTGVDYCLSELRSRPLPATLQIELELPPGEATPAARERLERTLQRYCQHRMAHNQRERRAVRLDGLSSLRVGLPVAAVGLAIALAAAGSLGTSGNTTVVLDSVGWVLAWVGLWFPLDSLLFTPLVYGRENRVLACLSGARVVVKAHDPASRGTYAAGSYRLVSRVGRPFWRRQARRPGYGAGAPSAR
jgi:hypothetical protein